MEVGVSNKHVDELALEIAGECMVEQLREGYVDGPKLAARIAAAFTELLARRTPGGMMKERIIRFRPAYDKRHPTDPRKNYGIHGVELAFYLKRNNRAVQFILYTNWQLPEVMEELKARRYEVIDGDAHWMERPMPADLGYHSPVPMYDGQGLIRDNCELVGGGPCFCDGSSLNAERIYEVLLREGDDGVWRELEEYYKDTFAPEGNKSCRKSTAS